MKKNSLLVIFCFLFSASASADLFYQVGFEGGGGVYKTSSDDYDINAGGGIKLSIGTELLVADQHPIRLTGGYLFDRLSASDGSADFDTLTLDALYLIEHQPKITLGAGLSYHLKPSFSASPKNQASESLEFDGAFGLVFSAEYQLYPNLSMGAKYTDMDYDNSNGDSADASSFGIFLSRNFQ